MEKFMNNGTEVVINDFNEVVFNGEIYLDLINAGNDVKILVEIAPCGKTYYVKHFHRENKAETNSHYLARIEACIEAWNKLAREEKRPTYILPIKNASMAMGLD